MLQKSKLCIHVLKAELVILLRNILICFVFHEAIQLSDTITNVDITNKKNIMKDKDLIIGETTKLFTSSELSGNRPSQKEIDKFYKCVRLY